MRRTSPSAKVRPDAVPVTPTCRRAFPRAHVETRDQHAPLLATLVLHVVAATWLMTREVAPRPVPAADTALQVVFIDVPANVPRPAALATPIVVAAFPATAARPVAQAQAVATDDRRDRIGEAAPSDPTAPVVSPTTALVDTWPVRPAAPSAPQRYARDPLGAAPPDLVSVPPPVRLHMQPPPSLQRTMRRVAALITPPAGYEANPCPRVVRNLAALAGDGSDAGRALMAEEVRRWAQMCD